MKTLKKSAGMLEVRASPLNRTRGVLSLGRITVQCALGRSGIVMRKREGDGRHAGGPVRIAARLLRPDRGLPPATLLPTEPLTPASGWCDDPGHRLYNRPVQLPFSASHEKMWRDDRLYDIVVVLDCNLNPAVKGQGSAIFFHIARQAIRRRKLRCRFAGTHAPDSSEHRAWRGDGDPRLSRPE